MKEDLFVKNGLTIPGHEIEITASRAGGPGGQHVNRASTRITVRWNVKTSSALSEEQKRHLYKKLASELTKEGDLIIHSGASRSQQHNRKIALDLLAKKIKQGLYVPKKRMKTRLPKAAKEARLQIKKQRGELKKMRKKVIE